MPLMHCMECDHEWESVTDQSLCGWCGAGGYVLKSKTSLEESIKSMDELKNRINQSTKYSGREG